MKLQCRTLYASCVKEYPPHGMVDASIQISPTAFDLSSSLIVFNIATFVNRNRAEELIDKWKTEYNTEKEK